MKSAALYVVCRHNHLPCFPQLHEVFPKLDSVDEAHRICPMQKLIDITADPPHEPNQLFHICSRSLAHHGTAKDAAAELLAGAASLPSLCCQRYKFILRQAQHKTTFSLHAVFRFLWQLGVGTSYTHQENRLPLRQSKMHSCILLSGVLGCLAPNKRNCDITIRCLLRQHRHPHFQSCTASRRNDFPDAAILKVTLTRVPTGISARP